MASILGRGSLIASCASFCFLLACGSSVTAEPTVLSKSPDAGSGAGSDAGSGAGSDGGSGAAQDGAAATAPLTGTADQWTWIDVPGTSCDDGSPTGVGFYPSSKSTSVIVFMEGGGACWDFLTCAQVNTSVHGPYGAAQFQPSAFTGSVLDHADADNPFKDWSAVFIPYCTGDVHSGDNVITYTGNSGGSKQMFHKGRVNVGVDITRVLATFPSPPKLVVAGSSAGGGGALFNYPVFRAAWPNVPTYLLDDSLPLFEGDAITPALRTAWFTSWNLGPITDVFCGAGCRNDMSLYLKAVSTHFPNDRLALLSSEQDQTIRTFYGVTPQTFQQDLTAVATDVLQPTANFKYFVVNGQTHTMLGDPASFTTSTGSALWPWLTAMLTDQAWASVGP